MSIMDDESKPVRAPREYPRVDVGSVAVIEGWMTVPDMAAVLGLSRQRAHQIVGTLPTNDLRRLSETGKPIFLVSLGAVEKLQEAAAAGRIKVEA